MIQPKLILILSLIGLLSSCNPTQAPSTGSRSGQIVNSDGTSTNKAYIYKESPYMYGARSPNISIGSYARYAEVPTTNNQLTGNCSFASAATISNCIHAYSSNEAPEQLVPKNANETWFFTPGSKEFYQANSLYHVQSGVNKFFEKLQFALSTVTNLHRSIPRTLPSYLTSSKLFWFKTQVSNSGLYFANDHLSIYSQCNLELNAQFQPAGPNLCFGKWTAQPNFFLVQDPSIIYHELGHALVSIMMNTRNGTSADASTHHPYRSNLGGYGYDEAGAINEGIADYYSFVMNKRKHMGEWGIGVSANASRPMTEADPAHISGLDTTSEGRLSYPAFLMYDSNDPDHPTEGVHYAGQITSHYLVALTESLQNSCGFGSDANTSHETATSYVMLLLAETLGELGDLRARGIDNYYLGTPYEPGYLPDDGYYFTNLDRDSSYMWTQIVNPPTYRRFYQIFAKNVYKYIPTLCPSFGKLESEKLLDDYGLLLFKNYNDNGKSTKDRSKRYSDAITYPGSLGTITTSLNPTSVTESARRKSVLVSKQLIDLATTDATKNRSTYYIIDDQTSMRKLLQNLLFKGFGVNISSNVSSVDYNNSNVRISPGEVVAIIPNLYNSSNSTMGGVQILANDWDHVEVQDTATGNFKPCAVDEVTTVDQGATTGNTCNNTLSTYKRLTKSSGTYPTEAVAPVCMVQLEESGSTRWVSQNEFRKKQGLSLLDNDCLGYSSTNSASVADYSFNPHECLVRVLPGANSAFFSKIEPQKSYIESVRLEGVTHNFDVGNALIMEVNKNIPPKTKFRCRLRARFSNCSDCFSDPTQSNDDFIDREYNGAKPFKVLNFEFEVND